MMEHFDLLDIRAGTVIEAGVNSKAKNPALVLTIDFGEGIGIKTSSAQIASLYTPESLIGRQVLALINVPPRNVAGILSEVLVLGCHGPEGVVLITPGRPVPRGSKLG